MPPPPSSSPLLPALTVALGLPLCHRDDTSHVTSVDRPSLRLVPRRSKNEQHLRAEARAKNNVSRIYARRLMNRVDLERGHPWLLDERERGASSSRRDVCRESAERSTDGVSNKLLSEALVSLIHMKYPNNDMKAWHPKHTFQKSAAVCESSFDFPAGTPQDGKERTLIAYNSLSAAGGKGGASKPAEWGDDTDLHQRRLEFGQQISPLSNTTRMERWGMAAKRMVTLGCLAAPLGVLVPMNWMFGGLAGRGKTDNGDEDASLLKRYHVSLTKKTWDYALWAVETAGPTYIKLVQWASTRNDLFSPEFVGHFSKLQDETRGHSWRETEVALERAFGKEWRKILSFDKINMEGDSDEQDTLENRRLKGKGDKANRERQKRLERNETKQSSSSSSPTIPIGSGCVAQVYKARLRSSHGLHPAGTSVAVKVQHPHIRKFLMPLYSHFSSHNNCVFSTLYVPQQSKKSVSIFI
jgi:hypothetical protein